MFKYSELLWNFTPACPFPISQYPHVLLAHGGGGKLMHQLIGKMFLAAFCNPLLETQHDAAVLELTGKKIAFTTDSYVVRPLFFPGGDIGSMAVHGTVNDLAMAGARPLYLSSAFIIEEGLPMETFGKLSARCATRRKNAACKSSPATRRWWTRARATAVHQHRRHRRHRARTENRAAKRAARRCRSWSAAIWGGTAWPSWPCAKGWNSKARLKAIPRRCTKSVLELLKAGIEIHCLRDLTRGGLASALNEIAEAADLKIAIEEKSIPVREDVHAACEMLGLDPLHVACEGRFAAFIPATDAERALAILRARSDGRGRRRHWQGVAKVRAAGDLKSAIGVQRILDMASGEQLPRIC